MHLDPAPARDGWPQHAIGGAQVVAVVGGKGGVGKTNVALNVGLHLAQRGRRVILLDADCGLANADILLNVTPRAGLDDLLDPTRTVEEVLTPAACGLALVCRPSPSARPLRTAEWRRILARLRPHGEILLVDCGGGNGAEVLTLARAADLVLATTTPEPTALADTYATLKVLCQGGYEGRVGCVVNMAADAAEAAAVARRLAGAAARFLGLTVTYLGGIRLDRHVPRAVRARVPVVLRYPRCRASACLRAISAQLAPAADGPPQAAGLWTRMAGLFL